MYGVLEAVVPEASAELWDLWCTEMGASGSEWEGGLEGPAPDWEQVPQASGAPAVPAGVVRVRHYFETPPPGDPHQWLAGFRTRFPDAPPPVTFAWRLKPVEAWATQWRQHFGPLRVGDRLIICPPWDPSVAPSKVPAGSEPNSPKGGGRLRIVIDPGRGFGTGRHASTALALQLIERVFCAVAPPPSRMLDVGTGSGILLIAARLLGAKEAWGCDVDPAVEPELRRNLALSGVAGRGAGDVVFRLGRPDDLVAERGGAFDLVTANLTAPLLMRHAADFTRLTSPHGHLIVSGMLIAEVEAVLTEFPESGWTQTGRVESEGWSARWLTRRPG